MSRRVLFAAMGIGRAAMCSPAFMPMSVHERVHLVYNPTDSVPRGWYQVGSISSAAALHVDSIVLARLPRDVAAFAGQRGYLPKGVPILKRVGAIAPQSVCVREQVVLIDGAVAATARTQDGARRPLQAWQHCRLLARGELFLLRDTNPAPFDSRYFAPSPPLPCSAPRDRCGPGTRREACPIASPNMPPVSSRAYACAALRRAGSPPPACSSRCIAAAPRAALHTRCAASGRSEPGADAEGGDGGQDKRSRHCVARKGSLHVGLTRHRKLARACRTGTQTTAVAATCGEQLRRLSPLV